MGIVYIKKIILFLKQILLLSKLWLQKIYENSPFSRIFNMFKALKKNMWTSGFLYQKSFSLIKCSPNRFNFFVNFNIFHKKGSMCSKN
jgi:hypothetical protein